MNALSEHEKGDGPERRAILAHRTVWRWHFYAGLFCIPFVIILSLTGAAYLFKPQVEAFLDSPYDNLVLEGGPRSPEAQVRAAIAAAPEGSRLRFYEVRRETDDAARVILSTPNGPLVAFVHPEANVVLGLEREADRPMEVIKTIHGELLMGERGSILVELAAGWAVVMILTGLVLWFPRGGRGPGGVLWPRRGLGGRLAWRDLHAVTGFWVSGLALFLLLTGLPWTTVWNDAFKEVRRATGTLNAPQEWSSGRKSEQADEHAAHRALAGHPTHSGEPAAASLDRMAASARLMDLPPPVLIAPPAPGGGWRSSPVWTVRSETPNRPQRVVMTLDPVSGQVTGSETFAGKHPIDQAIGFGIAAHEGQLFGLANQLLGLLAATGLVTLSVSGIVMWRRRGPQGVLGAPERLANVNAARGVGLAILALGVFMPVLGASLILVALVEFLVLRRIPRVRSWLGLDPVR
ncbi:MAG: hypothetical protein RL588_273 [Pseudomonadota bacterium]